MRMQPGLALAAILAYSSLASGGEVCMGRGSASLAIGGMSDSHGLWGIYDKTTTARTFDTSEGSRGGGFAPSHVIRLRGGGPVKEEPLLCR
jgi:hypothetical protein